MDPQSILLNLEEFYGDHNMTTRCEISKQLFCARMNEGTSMQAHVFKLIDLIIRLSQLWFVIDKELNEDLIL